MPFVNNIDEVIYLTVGFLINKFFIILFYNDNQFLVFFLFREKLAITGK
jgi:hypothetical protein